MRLLIVHLSDIHATESNNFHFDKPQAIASALHAFAPGEHPSFLVVTGDLAFSGKRTQYNIFNNFIRDLCSAMGEHALHVERVITVPGNHDCDFDGESKVRQAILRDINQCGTIGLDEAIVKGCTETQDTYKASPFTKLCLAQEVIVFKRLKTALVARFAVQRMRMRH